MGFFKELGEDFKNIGKGIKRGLTGDLTPSTKSDNSKMIKQAELAQMLNKRRKNIMAQRKQKAADKREREGFLASETI